MKKVLFIFTFILLLFSTSQSFATTKCLPEKTILDTKNSNSSDIQTAEENYTTCLEDLFNIWYDAINKWNYLTAVDVFTSYLKLDPGNEGALFNLNLSYKELWLDAFNKEDWKKSINYYLKALSVDKNDFDSLYNLWWAYYNQDLYKEALEYYKKSYKVAENEDDLKIAKDMIDNTTLIIENGKDLKWMPTNDPLSWYQYYLKKQNIIKAWEQVKEPTNKVIIAIIDDWININHPDLKWRIWTNSKEIPWDKIDNDKNGFIDDFNGWNFVYKNNNTLPLWWHW